MFAGSYETWRSFHDLFVSLIHRNTSLSAIQKLHYLKSSVTGETERLLLHLNIDDSNYDKAWTILTDRYDHKRILVDAQLKLFFGQPVIQTESVDAIKKLLDTSSEVLHSLQNLHIPFDQWDTIVIFILLQKLPVCTQQLWEEKLGVTKELPTFTDFSQFLETRFRTLEAVMQQRPRSSPTIHKPTARQAVFHIKPVQKQHFSCKVCNKTQHSLRNCNKFLKMDIPERFSQVNNILSAF